MKLRVWLTLVVVIVPILLVAPSLISAGRPPVAKYLKPLELTALDSGIAGIDSIYCINLDIRKEKWNAVKEQLAKQELHANRVPAINGWTELTKYDRRRLLSAEKVLTPGQIGCFLSHLSVLKNAASHQFERILILEDDVEFVAPVKELDSYLTKLTELDPDWDILFLDQWKLEDWGLKERFDRPDSKMSEVIKKPKEMLAVSTLSRVYYRHGLYAAVISEKGVQKMLCHYLKKPFLLAIDTEMNHIEEIRMYETDKMFAKVHVSISDTSYKPK